MTKEEWDFIGAMNMCDEISNEAYKKISCHCEEQEPCEDAVSRQAVLNEKYLIELEDGQSFYCINPEDVEALPPVTPTACIAKVTFSEEDLQKIVDEKVKELALTQRWIPVSERLPEDGTWNIFTNGEQISVERYKADALDHFYPSGRWFPLEDAIAWMPLPEPYQREVSE